MIDLNPLWKYIDSIFYQAYYTTLPPSLPYPVPTVRYKMFMGNVILFIAYIRTFYCVFKDQYDY